MGHSIAGGSLAALNRVHRLWLKALVWLNGTRATVFLVQLKDVRRPVWRVWRAWHRRGRRVCGGGRAGVAGGRAVALSVAATCRL